MDNEAIVKALDDLRGEVKELRLHIVGDKIQKITGVVDILETHRKEIYGDEDTRHVGLKQLQETDRARIVSLEGDRMKVMAVATAASSVVAIVWILIKAFFLK